MSGGLNDLKPCEFPNLCEGERCRDGWWKLSHSLPVATSLSVSSVFTYFVEFTVLPCSKNSVWTTPSLSQKIVRSTIIHHDNARPHTSLETRMALDRLGLRTLPHPPYSPDLAPSDFFLFPKLKDYLKGNRYETDEDVKNAVLSWCRDKTADFFADGIQQVVRRWRLCIERDGDYVEKCYVIWC